MSCYHDKDRVIKILVSRDNMTFQEAKQLVIECQEALLEANNDSNADILADKIIMDYLGLEPHYFFDIMSV